MPKAAYAFTTADGLVKIVKRAKGYYVYRLKEIIVDRRGNKKFIFDKHYLKKWPYKPYEDSDVFPYPDIFYRDVARWEPYMIRRG